MPCMSNKRKAINDDLKDGTSDVAPILSFFISPDNLSLQSCLLKNKGSGFFFFKEVISETATAPNAIS